MEPQTLLVAVAVFVLSALLIYLISFFGMREKSFDEVMAEQKKRQEEELQKSRSERKAEKENKKTRGRRKVDKIKDKGAQYSQAEVSEISAPIKNKTLEYEPDPEIITPEDFPIREHKQTKSKGKKSKPILVNKDEKTLVSSDLHAPLLFNRHTPPKDELELKHSHEIESHRMQKEKREEERQVVTKREEKLFDSVKVKEDIVIQQTINLQSSVPVQNEAREAKATEKKKSKSQIGSGDAESPKAVSTTRLIESVRGASLNDGEVQTMIDILLNKQQGSVAVETWSKKSQKGDPVALLRRQLEEKERSLQEAQEQAMSAGDKLKEVKQETVQEKTRYSNLDRSTKEKMALQLKEIQALHARMQQTHETHTVEKTSLQARVSQMENQMGSGNLLQKLTDENKQLTDSLSKVQAESIPAAERTNLTKKIQLLEAELNNSHVKLNASENTKKTMEGKVVRYEEQLRTFENEQKGTTTVLSKQLEEVGQQLRKTEVQKNNLSTDLQKATEAMKTAQAECHSLKTKLKELERTLSGVDENSKGLQAKLEASEQEKSALRTSVQTLEQRLDEAQKRRTEKDKELNDLRVENRALADQLRKETERQQGEGQEEPPKAAGAPNGDIHHETKLEKNTIQLAEHEKILGEKDKEIFRLTSDLGHKHEEIDRLLRDVETQKKKNNEKSAVQIAEYESEDKAVLQRLFPEISVAPSLPHKEWMSSFEREAKVSVTVLLSKATSHAVDPSLAKGLKEAEEKALDATNRLREADSRNLDATNRLKIAEEKALDATNKLKIAEQRALDVANRLKEADDKAANAIDRLTEADNRASNVTNILKEAEDRSNRAEVMLREANERSRQLEEEVKKGEARLREAESSSSQTTHIETRLSEVEGQREKLDSQVKEYRKVLSETEDKLQQLERSVESEEQKWVSRLQATEQELHNVKLELSSVREENSQFKGSRETEDKVTTLESQLKTTEVNYTTVQKQFSEAQLTITSLRSQLSQVEKSSSNVDLKVTVDSLHKELTTAEDRRKQLEVKIVELQKQVTYLEVQLKEGDQSNSDLDALKKLIAELRAQVEEEKKKTKDMASNIVRLNGMLKTGQDALAAEQKLVKELQDQLAKDSPVSPADVEEVKAKLHDTQKQLEKEIMANRQLSQRLVASAGNDVGTSV